MFGFKISLAILCIIVLNTWFVEGCTNDNDCPYGRCDKLKKMCVCKQVCTSFEQRENHCFTFTSTKNNRAFTRPRPRDLCRHLNDHCAANDRRKSHKLMFPGSSTIENCKNKEYKLKFSHEFCEKQSYCSNGICLKDSEGQRFCVCDEGFIGERCGIFTGQSKNPYKYSSISIGVIVVISAFLVAFIALVTIVVKKCRSVNNKGGHIALEESSTEISMNNYNSTESKHIVTDNRQSQIHKTITVDSK